MSTINITWEDVPAKFIMLGDNVSVGLSDNAFIADDLAKCFCCGGWLPFDRCSINHDEKHVAVPVCKDCQ